MKKIPTLFVRDPENRKLVTQEVNPGCEWVMAGEGVATRKYDGTCCLIEEGKLYKRREVKDGKPVPEDFREANYDPVTKKRFGWVPVGDGPEDKYYWEAYGFSRPVPGDGTYELCGPKVQGNPEEYDRHFLIPHAHAHTYPGVSRTFEGIKEFLRTRKIEGLVFHHPDGRMAKIKKRDFSYED